MLMSALLSVSYLITIVYISHYLIFLFSFDAFLSACPFSIMGIREEPEEGKITRVAYQELFSFLFS